MTEADKKQRGNLGEEYVCEYLKKTGYRIICKNYRRKCGEIDIIAEKNGVLAFTEVKTRSENPLLSGIYAVDRKKQMRIVKTARIFLAENGARGKEIRFDAAEVIITRSETPEIIDMTYYESAFDPDGSSIFLYI